MTNALPPITTDHFQVILCLCAARRAACLAISMARHSLVEGICLSVTRDMRTMPCRPSAAVTRNIIGYGHRPPQWAAFAETAGLRTKRYTNAGLVVARLAVDTAAPLDVPDALREILWLVTVSAKLSIMRGGLAVVTVPA